MSFLGILANQINSQLQLGENTNHSLDSVIDGQNVKYGSLGDLAKKFDQSAQRSYVEEGYLRRDPYNADPKQLEILMQEPNATVLVKKRMFSTIVENYRPDYMDVDEKLYYKTIKVLFNNKCRQISSLEKLSKIQKISSATGSVSDSLMPIIITLSDSISGGSNSFLDNLTGNTSFGSKPDPSKLSEVADRLRKIYSFNHAASTTSWLTDDSNLFQNQFGKGTGVIELTNFTNLNTNVSVDGIKNPGSFSMTIVDPYDAMRITEWDIEKAIADATSLFKNKDIFQFASQDSTQIINDKQSQLNQLRNQRGVGSITIKVNPDTLLGKRVVAIFERTGTELPFDYNSAGGLGGIFSGSVEVSDDYLKGGSVAGIDGLNTQNTSANLGPDHNIRQAFPSSELQVFKDLISAIFTKIQFDANSRNAFQISNKNTNYARKKLRFNFLGKLIVQPMDIVHIYMSSKSQYDNKILSGLNNMFTGFGLVQSINALTNDIKNATSLLLNPSDNASIQAEKAAYVGKEFPNYLWTMLRSTFVNEKEGTHVFAGVVDTANSGWDAGKFTVNVQGRDNTVYFDQGKINFKPGVDTFNGAIFDPLTPFKTNFDTITSNAKDETPELLDENKAILGSSKQKNGLVKSKSGPDAGKKVYADNFISDKFVDPTSGLVSRRFHAPDGLVYKWKEGIGVFVQFGNSLELNDANKTGTPNIAKEPFAGQDIMNVLSLLVTGKPYNYSNFWRAASNIDGFMRDPQSQQDAAHSYIISLQNDIIKTNTLWGNFIPFKNLVIDEQSFALAQQSIFRIIQKNKEIDSKLVKLNDLNQAAAAFGAVNALSNNSKSFSSQFQAVQSASKVLTESINADIDAIKNEDANRSIAMSNAGADASYDYSEFIDSSKTGIAASDPNSRRELRRQLNYLTRRMSYNVRANEDKNLFIVDDFYDKDFDILAYEQSLTDGLGLYNNDFNSTREKINITADLLNLEVFADTQGHIRVRPPQYNRMPSSVFYRMMYLKQAYGVQVFPQFLDDIFSTQIDTLRKRLEVLEDMIRLDCAIVNDSTDPNTGDADAINFILNGSSGAVQNTGSTFYFISDPSSGNIVDINRLIHAVNPDDSMPNTIAFINDFITNLQSQAESNKQVFNNSIKYATIIDQLSRQNSQASGYSLSNISEFNANGYIDQLISRIQTKSGQQISKKDYIVQNELKASVVELPVNTVIDILKVTNELQQKLQERQKVLKLFYSALKNSQEFRYLDASKTEATNQLLSPAIYGNSHVPEVFEHMIEDEGYDDYGPGSGHRYIIKRAQIKSLQITENPPDFTMVEVQGILNTFAPNALPDGLNAFPSNGNGLVTAVAVDYDSWRNYGFKNQAVIKVPFLSNPNSQCAPYASMILSRNRKNILRGSVTISGNEYMQPGEVVYLQDNGLLFYVTAVRHNFSFGSSFTTTLDLTYGHSPGEYIPTTLDVIGKMIYNNRDIAGYIIERQSSSGNETNLGVVQLSPYTNDPGLPNTNSSSNPVQSNYINSNSTTLNNILFTAAYNINANGTKGNNIKAKIELRIYYDNNNAANTKLKSFADQVKSLLIGKVDGPFSNLGSTAAFTNKPFPDDSVSIELINVDETQDRRSPSQKAIDAARNTNSNNFIALQSDDSKDTSNFTQPVISNDKIRASLFGYIVDCWLSFEQVVDETPTGMGS